MKLQMLKFVFILMTVQLIFGCASRKEIVRFKDDTAYLRQQVEVLRNENKAIRKAIVELHKSLTSLQDENRQTKADILAELDNLKNQSQILDSKIDEQAYRPSSSPKNTPDKIPTPELSAESADTTIAPFAQTQPDSQTSDRENLKELYNAAYLDITRGNYKMAITGFLEFLYKFPDDDLADNAQYWIGEAYYAQKNYDQAIEEFEKVTSNYPKGDKVAAALLKIGYSYTNLQYPVIARNYLQMVIEQHLNSEEARLATSWLS